MSRDDAHRHASGRRVWRVALALAIAVPALIAVDWVGTQFAQAKWVAGHDAYMTGDYGRAERLFRQARYTWFGGGSADWHGASLYKLHRYGEALRVFDRGDSPQQLSNIGVTSLALGETGRAVQALERAVTGDPSSALYRHNLGIALARAGERDAAQMQMKRARQLDPLRAASWRGPQILPMSNR